MGPEVEPPAELGRVLDRLFGTRSCRGVPLALHPAWRDPASGQVLSSAVVDALLDRAEALGRDPARCWTLGLTDADLYAPGLDFVFGEAAMGGGCAVVSLARLREGAGSDPATFRTRLLTEAVHEVGHLAGLDHCPDPGCVMNRSACVEESDRKGPHPCAACRALLSGAASVHDA